MSRTENRLFGLALLLGSASAAAEEPAPATTTPSPWGDVFSFEPDPEEGEAPPTPEGEAPPMVIGSVVEEPPSLAPAPPAEAPPAPPAAVAPPVSAPVAAPAPRPAKPALEPQNGLAGHRITAFDPGTGVAIGQASVVGQHGGVHATTVTARHRVNDLIVSVGVPWANYRTAEGRQLGLGNLELGVAKLGSSSKMDYRIGLEVKANLVDDMYTWVNRPADLWPAWGGALVWQGQQEKNAFTLLYRAHAGVYKVAAYDPYPDLLVNVGGAVAADLPLYDDRAGLTGELAFAWWDTSPLELAALGRVDPIEGLRVRGGFVFPLGVWTGMTPARLDGARETTLLLDLSMAF